VVTQTQLKCLKEYPTIQGYLKGLAKCLDELSRQERTIAKIAEIIFDAYKKEKQVIVMGNGGSASTASHCALGFEKQSAIEGKPRLRSKSLTDNIGLVTAWANDLNYDSIFAQQLKNELEENDVVIGISASGNSPNVLRAIEYAKSKGAASVGLTGFGGGKLKELAEECIVLSSHNYGQVEDAHLAVTHILSDMLKEKIAGSLNRAVFLDRDGTIAPDVHYCRRPEDFMLFPSATRAIKMLNERGFKVIVVTNQSAVARGYTTEEMLSKIHQKMEKELEKEGARVDGIYYCPHHPDDNCDCRKPKPKLVLQAAKDFNIDLKKSFVVGDLWMDIALGKSVGCRTILVGNSPSPEVSPDDTAPDLLEAARTILKRDASR